MLLNLVKKSSAPNSIDLNRMTVFNELNETFKNERAILSNNANMNHNDHYLTNNQMSSSFGANGSSGVVKRELANAHQVAASSNNRKSNEGGNDPSTHQEEIIGEQEFDDCVYIIKHRKEFNREQHQGAKSASDLLAATFQSNSQQQLEKSTNGVYKPLPNDFRSQIYDQLYPNGGGGGESTSKPGLVYTTVKVKQLKYATLAKFVECLTKEETGALDLYLTKVFLTTYRSFTDTKTALSTIRARYEKILPASLEMTEDVRVANVNSYKQIIRLWVLNFPEDFVDKANLDLMNEFCAKHMNDPTDLECKRIQELLKAKYDDLQQQQPPSNENSQQEVKLVDVDVNNNEENELSNELKAKAILDERTTKSSKQHRRTNSSGLELVRTREEETSAGAKALLLALMPASTASSSSSTTTKDEAIGGRQKLATNIDSTTNSLSRANSNSVLHSNQSSTSNLFDMNFMNMNSVFFAQQLTYIDKCLFAKACAHYCIANVWNTRYKNNNNNSNQNRSSAINLNALNNEDYATSKLRQSTHNLNGLTSTNSRVINDKFAANRECVDQFNFISFMVQATILENLSLKASSSCLLYTSRRG